MTDQIDLSGIILAGGYSTRFGEGDKALAELDGKPMVARVAERLIDGVDQLVVNCRDDQRSALDDALNQYSVDFAVDPVPDQGPLAAIHTALSVAEGECSAVVACDMPFVNPSFLQFLQGQIENADAAIPRMEDGWFQPTQAVYRSQAMFDASGDALDAGEGKILAGVDRLDAVYVEQSAIEDRFSLRTFENVNTLEELEDAEREIRARR